MSVMVTAVAFSALLILTVAATRLITRLSAQHAESIEWWRRRCAISAEGALSACPAFDKVASWGLRHLPRPLLLPLSWDFSAPSGFWKQRARR
ncbi:hypothetical protein OOK36_54695 [Streptomyces sp. NBC_00365]|uniref:hypothetical protein n=1 Tax=Streptomyces sp. NBC_00365 TaxID=2975726 RepID=UPI0022554F34|nr:hypothetical protein [Streptomyces sp. NBC_00365]MCX5097520.1 hypothetical protein [Streptomyces sp. NBC_00365]